MTEQLGYFEGFFEDVGDGSPFEVVLRGHLWVEYEVMKTLEAALPFPAMARLDRLTFPTKVGLLAALGLIGAQDRPAFDKLNALWNRLAHDVTAAPNQRDETDLWNCLSARQRPLLKGLDEGVFPHRLRMVIMSLCIRLQMDRQRHEEAHARLRASAQRLLDAAGEASPTRDRTER